MEEINTGELLHKETNLEISLHQDGFLYANWIGFQNEERVKAGCEKMLLILKEKNVSNVLNDNTKVTGPWQ